MNPTDSYKRPIRLLFLNGDLPVFPGWGGHDYLNVIYLTQFAEVGLVSQIHSLEQKEKAKKLVEAGIHLYAWENPAMLTNGQEIPHRTVPRWRRFARKFLDLLWGEIVQRPADTFIQDLTLRNMAGAFIKAIEEKHWDALVIVQSSRSHWLDYLPRFPFTMLVLHDVRALVYERQARAGRTILEKFTARRGASQYRRFEQEKCAKFDLAITVSPADEAWMRKNYSSNNVCTAVLPVDSKYFSPMLNLQEKEARIVFTGMMNHPPNVDAAIFFAKEVFPKIRACIPSAEFWIVGRDPTYEVRALDELPGVTVTGLVPDIRPYIAEAAVVVVPLRFGAGMRNKILEAWSMQKYIISSTIGAEGLPYLNGENLQIADDVDTWIRKVVEGIEDVEMRAKIKMSGRRLVVEEHNPEKLAREYSQLVIQEFTKKQLEDDRFYAFVDLRWMKPGLAGGIENLSRSFLNELRKIDFHNHYTVLVPPEVKFDFDNRRNSNMRFVMVQGPKHYIRRTQRYAERILYKITKRDYWRTGEIDYLQNLRDTNATIALSIPGYIYPELYPLRNVLIVPDIQHEFFPQFFDAAELVERRRIYTDSIRRADHLCAISEFTRQTLIERLNVEPQWITTTHLAADPIFHPDSCFRTRKNEIVQKYQLPLGEYLFLPANTWPHKNHKAAFRALQILRDEHHINMKLVCTGSAKRMHSSLVDLIEKLKLEKNIHFLGYCPVDDLPGLYEGAAALVFPSLFEGFGMPVLEAMWCDCPVICSNTSSLPEIAGDAALMADPNSPETIAYLVYQSLTDSNLRQAMVSRGREQAEKFSWRKFTLQIVSILSKIDRE